MRYDSRYLEIDFPDSIFSLRTLPAATKYISISYIACTVTLYILRHMKYLQDPSVDFATVYIPFMQLVPSQLWPYPFSIILSNLIDVEIWKIGLNMINLVGGGAFIERNWNSHKEMFIFILVIGSLTNLLVVTITFILSIFTEKIKLDVPLDGNYTVIIGFAIIYKQLLPETTILHIKNIPLISKNFRFKLLPIFMMFIITMVQLIWFHHFAQLLSIWITFVASWVYLRFFQVLYLNVNAPDNNEKTVGDASDTFQFIYLFPDVMKPVLRPIFDFVYQLVCIRLKIIRPFQIDDVDRGNTVALQRGAKRTTVSTEERRKQLALEVLQERMV